MKKTIQAVLVTAFAVCGFSAEHSSSVDAAAAAGKEHLQAREDNAQGRISEAEGHYVRALALWDDAGEDYLSSKCMTLLNLGELHRELQRMDEAEKELTEAVAIARRFQSKYPQQYPGALSRLGALYSQTGREESGRTLVKQAVTIFEGLRDAANAELAYAYNSLGLIDIAQGHPVNGEVKLREAVRLSQLGDSGDRRETLAYQTNLALALIKLGQFDRAETLLVYVRSGVEALPHVPQQLLGTVFAELSAIAFSANKLSLAEEYAGQELDAMRRQIPSSPLAVALASVNLGVVYISEGRAKEAEAILPDAVAEERRLRASSGILANAVRRLAELRALQQSWDESRALYREALELFEAAWGPHNPEIRSISREYAAVRKRTGAKSL